MIYLLYGSDTYHSRHKLREIISQYQQKNGSYINMHTIDCEEKDILAIKDLCEGESLFSGKKLVIAENFLHDSSHLEFVMPLLHRLQDSADTIVIFWMWELHKEQQKKCETLFRIAHVAEFPLLSGAALKKFIEEEIKKRELHITSQEYQTLFSLSDSWAIINTLDRMMLEERHEGGVVFSSGSLFSFGDMFFSHRLREGFFALLSLRHQGEDEFGAYAYIANHTRTVLLIKAFVEARQPIPESFGIHPYVIKKTSTIVKNLSLDFLLHAHNSFFEEDVRIKIGLSKPRDSLIRMLMARAK